MSQNVIFKSPASAGPQAQSPGIFIFSRIPVSTTKNQYPSVRSLPLLLPVNWPLIREQMGGQALRFSQLVL